MEAIMSELILSASSASNRVLRNTYWLLAASLIPTIIGTWLGVIFGFGALVAASPIVFMLGFLALASGLIFAIHKNRDTGAGVVLLLGFTGFMGLMLSPLIGTVLGFSNGVSLITIAAAGTGAIFAIAATLAGTIKRDVSSWGKFLMVGVIGLIIASLANIWLQIPALMLTVSVLAVVIFSAFLFYDVKRVIDGGETNYVSATLSVYLDLFNIFQSLLNILGITRSDE